MRNVIAYSGWIVAVIGLGYLAYAFTFEKREHKERDNTPLFYRKRITHEEYVLGVQKAEAEIGVIEAKLVQAKSHVEHAKVNVAQSRDLLNMYDKLKATRSISNQDWLDMYYRHSKDRAMLTVAEGHVAELQASLVVAQKHLELEKVQPDKWK